MRWNVALALLLACATPTALAAATRTVAGVVSKNGAGYTLVVNGDVYTVTAGKTQQEKLARRVGKVAVVLGDVEGMSITAEKVSTPKKIKKH